MSGHEPPQDVARAAQRAVDWIAEGKAGKGFTETGEHRAHQLAERRAVPEADIKKMQQYFARHEVDRDAEGFQQGDEGYPSPGRVAWDAWGGDAGREWVGREKFSDL